MDLVKEFPYIMYSVRLPNGSTRWSQGVYVGFLGYYVKYISEFNKTNEYINKFHSSGLEIDEFYKSIDLYKI